MNRPRRIFDGALGHIQPMHLMSTSPNGPRRCLKRASTAGMTPGPSWLTMRVELEDQDGQMISGAWGSGKRSDRRSRESWWG